ncbi:MAG TPA: Type 1 glutamine amidotransferase-like domain-containing protein [Kouleothrix sp.]|uniref:Type 1 glutamine amidotransferase-like domain-containing protein n=1 Tax=Kouleothrix sp. TaxID=2779161 RepID=UPI002CC8D2E2|nr:Type 1 glutamine amidotransferase-like domain-containing protein [Kouleothrix sp.]
MMETQPSQPGAIALVGSGEYLPQMLDIDRFLLSTLASAAPRVALLPTASGLELGMPERWNTMGVDHFRALGVAATPVHLVGAPDAADEPVLAALRGADMYYFSGGNPEYVIETLRGTPAWQIVHSAWRAGAVLAGCSAGAMMLGGYTLSVRSVMRGDAPRWLPALGVVPELVLMPHFDRVADFAGQAMFRAILASAPAGLTLVGVDEDTALVRTGTPGSWRWQVLGRQSVSVFSTAGERARYHAGDDVPLPFAG